jgi:hypothetical protein
MRIVFRLRRLLWKIQAKLGRKKIRPVVCIDPKPGKVLRLTFKD